MVLFSNWWDAYKHTQDYSWGLVCGLVTLNWPHSQQNHMVSATKKSLVFLNQVPLKDGFQGCSPAFFSIKSCFLIHMNMRALVVAWGVCVGGAEEPSFVPRNNSFTWNLPLSGMEEQHQPMMAICLWFGYSSVLVSVSRTKLFVCIQLPQLNKSKPQNMLCGHHFVSHAAVWSPQKIHQAHASWMLLWIPCSN